MHGMECPERVESGPSPMGGKPTVEFGAANENGIGGSAADPIP